MEHIGLDLGNEDSMRHALAKTGDVTHVFFCAYQYTGSFAKDATVNFDLFRNLIQALERTSKNLKHVFFMSGTKWYGKCRKDVSRSVPCQSALKFEHFRHATRIYLSCNSLGVVQSRLLYVKDTALGRSRHPARRTMRGPLLPVSTTQWRTFASSAKQKARFGPGLP